MGDAQGIQKRNEVSHTGVGIPEKTRGPTAPESRADALQGPLAVKVMEPHVRTMILVAIALYG
jgi:hypothetical protein